MPAKIDRRTLVFLLGTTTAMGVAGVYVAQGTPIMTVYKDRNCGCCKQWARHVEEAGMAVRILDVDDIMAVKLRLGVPRDLQSCHTAEISG